MEFTSYLIKRNTDKPVVSGNTIVLVLIIAALVTGVTGFVRTATVLFILAVAAGIILFAIKKGNTQPYVLSKNKLVISSASIEIEEVVYEMEKIKDLRFVIHSYAGLKYAEGKSRIYH